MDFVESCRRLIAIDSTPTHGNRELVTFLSEMCEQKGLRVEIMDEVIAERAQANIIVRPKSDPVASKDFLLQAHLDTSDPGPFGFWKTTGFNPFDAHIISGNIYGLGAADVKLDFLCKLEAMASSVSSKSTQKFSKRNPVLLGTFGEESGMIGALKYIRKGLMKADLALIGEPSQLQLMTAGKGIATVEITVPFSSDELSYRETHNLQESISSRSRIFNGKSAHSSNPNLGDSAVKKMFDYLKQMPAGVAIMEMQGGVNFNTVPAHAFLEVDIVSGLKDPMNEKMIKIYDAILNLEESFLQYEDSDFNPPNPTLNIGVINTTADHIFISGTCRIPPKVTHETYEIWMRELAQVCQQSGAQFRVSDYKRPFRTNAENEFVQESQRILKEMGLSVATATHSSANEASLFSRVGVQCISFGPGRRENNVHTPEEHVSISDLEQATSFYRHAIERFCV